MITFIMTEDKLTLNKVNTLLGKSDNILTTLKLETFEEIKQQTDEFFYNFITQSSELILSVPLIIFNPENGLNPKLQNEYGFNLKKIIEKYQIHSVNKIQNIFIFTNSFYIINSIVSQRLNYTFWYLREDYKIEAFKTSQELYERLIKGKK